MQKGFTLVEVMIVVVIVMLLASIAVINYQNYMIKAQVSRVTHEVALLKNPIEICLSYGAIVLGTDSITCNLPNITSNLLVGNSQTQITDTIGMGVPQVSLPLSATVTITATLGNTAHTTITGKKIMWYRLEDGSWQCQTDVPENYRLSFCKLNLS